MRKWCVVLLMVCGAAVWGAAVPAAQGRDKRDPPLGEAASRRFKLCERMLANLPAQATGTFVQRKILADVEVTITSSGTFRFEKDKSFEWKTLKPLPSTFTATPESYTVTANGKTSTRALSELKLSAGLRSLVKGDLSALGDVFDVTETENRLVLVPKTRELREFVKRATLEGTDFPTRFTLDYVTGDRLEIDLVQSR